MNDKIKPEVVAIEKSSKRLADIISRTVPPLVGLIVAGPIGGIAGGIAGSILKYGLEDFFEKYLTPKEVKRVGTSAEYIISEINKNLKSGLQINQAIFESEEGYRSEAEELFEGVLLKCKNEYQEKKLKHISYIFVSVSFDSTISTDDANQMLNISEGLTFRQFCLLSLIGKNDNNKFSLRSDATKGYLFDKTMEYQSIIMDLWTLTNLGLIRRKDNLGLGNINDFAFPNCLPAQLKLWPLGERIFKSMNLNEIENSNFTFIDILK
jgi:hypothetical protein